MTPKSHRALTVRERQLRSRRRAFAWLIPLMLLLTLAHAFRASAQRVERIDRAQFETYLWWLDLAEDERRVAEIYFEDFTKRSDADFRQRARAYHAGIPSFGSEAYWNIYEQKSAERQAFMKDFGELAEVLFTDFATLLTEDQMMRVTRVRNARTRHLYRPGTRELPEGKADLASLLVGMTLTDEEWAALMPVLDEYEPIFIAALKRTQDAHVRGGKASARMVALLQELDRENTEHGRDPDHYINSPLYHEAQKLRDERTRITEPASIHLAQVNREWVARIEAALAEENADIFRRRFLETAYKPIHPDPAHADALYDAALALDDLTDEQRDILETLHEEFRRAHERLSFDMRDIYDRQQEARITASREKREYFTQGIYELAQAGLKREQLNEAQLTKINAILTPEQAKQLPEWDFTEHPRKRPFDWTGQTRQVTTEEELIRRQQRRERGGDSQDQSKPSASDTRGR